MMRAYRYKGQHRRGRFSQPVYELIADCRRIPLSDLFAIVHQQWEHRGPYEAGTAADYTGHLAHLRVTGLLRKGAS